MSAVTASAVAQLRARTGVSILACKQALDEAGGDEEKAIEILRKRGIAQAVKKADREQTEGALFVAQNPTTAAIVQLKCETDFVARSDDFLALGKEIAEYLLQNGLAKAQEMLAKRLPEAIQKLGENISVGEMQEIQAPVTGSYVHSNRKIAVVVGLDPKGDPTKAKDVAMHAAAMNPLYVHPDDVPAEAIAKEREIWTAQMKDEKKPAAILEKIMTGKERKFREENALVKQAFVKDPTMTIEKYLNGAAVTTYVRVTI
ncbi:translation elongation factor Ts [Candidatus Peregrinibacteria bacterium]|nr:translation elongation factor Ts [Candidatus Peregrinibacteria bacterium]MBI3816682.1 translation elongation factor Ts [Candidatus Peregrinibacteria bacterium]